MEFLDNLQKMLEQYLSNPYILALTKLFIILYSCLVAPTLPVEILAVFDNVVVKMLVLTLIFYSASIEPMMSILLGVGLFITLQTLNNIKLLNLVNDQIEGLENEENTNHQEEEEVPANSVQEVNDDTEDDGCYPAVTICEDEDNNKLKTYEGEDFSKF